MPVRDESYEGTEPLRPSDPALFDAVGGAEAIERLAEAFYARVARNPKLAPVFPQTLRRDGPGRAHLAHKLAQFLTELLGGPARYTERFGQGRMYARHLPFAIGPAEADAWVAEMTAALEESAVTPPVRAALRQLFRESADDLVNTPAGDAKATGGARRGARSKKKNPLRTRHH